MLFQKNKIYDTFLTITIKFILFMIEERRRITSFPIPDDISEIQKREFIGYQKSIKIIEEELEQLRNGSHEEQIRCFNKLKEIAEKRREDADERYDVRINLVDQRLQNQINKINTERDEAIVKLRDKMALAFSMSYHEITSKLKEFSDSEQNEEDQSEIPQVSQKQNEHQKRTRSDSHTVGEIDISVSSEECERDLKNVLDIIEK